MHTHNTYILWYVRILLRLIDSFSSLDFKRVESTLHSIRRNLFAHARICFCPSVCYIYLWRNYTHTLHSHNTQFKAAHSVCMRAHTQKRSLSFNCNVNKAYKHTELKVQVSMQFGLVASLALFLSRYRIFELQSNMNTQWLCLIEYAADTTS